MRDYNKFLESNTPCILWDGVKDKEGYGTIFWQGKNWKVHRLLFMFFRPDEFKKELFVCHHCDNPTCVNIEHLYAGTAKDNSLDRFEHGDLRGRKPRKKRQKQIFNKEETLKQLQFTYMKRKVQRRK